MLAMELGLTRRLRAGLVALATAAAPVVPAGPAAAQPECNPGPVPKILAQLRGLAGTSDAGARRMAITGLIDRWADGPSIARMALHGRWGRLSPPERHDLSRLLQQLTVARAATALARDGIAAFALLEARPVAGTDCLVASRVVDRHGRARIVYWRMRPAAGGTRIVDLLVDGVSLTRNLRDELDAILRDNGGDIAALGRRLRTTIARINGGRR